MLGLRSLNRFQAFGWHLLVSLCVALLSSCLVFVLWYPGLLAFASGVRDIFLLLLLVDMTLGPVITLLIFNPQKKELKYDLMIIVFIQIAALLYGLHTVFIARPVYIAFNSGRFDLVYANDISESNLAKATRAEYRSLPYFGPKLIAAPLPDDAKIREEIVMGAVTGGGDDVQVLPQYYVPYADRKIEVLSHIKPLAELKTYNKAKPESVDALINKYETMHTEVGYLQLKAKTHDLVVVLSRATGDILEMNELKPWW